jgi:hypothetical protein
VGEWSDSSVSKIGPVTESSLHENKLFISMEGGKLLDFLSNSQLLKNNHTPWN